VGGYAAFGDILEVELKGDHLKGKIQGMGFDLIPIAENRFRVSHWLLNLGLADLLQLPLDLRELEIEFQGAEEAPGDNMIIDFGGFNFEICPRYSVLQEQDFWETLAGTYELYERLPSGLLGSERLGESEIRMDGDRLFMSGAVGPILPIDERTLIILSGSFHGETITRDPEAGTLTHQGLVFKPVVLKTE